MIRFPFFSTRRFCLLACFLLCALALIPAANAEEKAKDAAIIYPRNSETVKAESAAAHSTGYGSGILVVALLLAGAGAWLFWRGRATPAGALNSRKLVLAETKSLGNRQYLVVAAYEDKKFLLSVCPGRIELLTPLDGGTPPVKTS